ncbi:hypothetical protein EZV73_08310 [Acidaminobacter sp. JC074]|uniref:stalk domain-containing protein n=1 Tax=Acidaminobacter sp. JC074 TaxID=2530199 RepID=UPI001F0F0897|nr:protease inhibitor I42 family protein [Acidaminobacter sp. JC074]MCH4887572.1 hypothetical protein [Acidaminobacter sp. JC074]
MKKVISILLILMMLTGVFADTAVPTLISVNEQPFGLEQDGDEFTIILDGNQTTGFAWTYHVKDLKHVNYISDEYLVDSDLMGAPGKHRFTFKVLADGVSTIDFVYSRSFEEGSEEKLDILVYKNGDKVFVEENQIVTINDVVVEEISADEVIDVEVMPQIVDGKHMVPVAETLRALGYTVTWKPETKSVEINKGAQWTSITIGENAYFKNRMAARPLSSAPVIVEGRTLVPAEFFYTILDIGVEIGDTGMTLNNFPMGTYQGYVKEIQVNDDVTSYFVTYEQGGDMVDIVLHTNETTYFQKEVKVGDMISALTSMATTMSLPPQTAAFIIY